MPSIFDGGFSGRRKCIRDQSWLVSFTGVVIFEGDKVVFVDDTGSDGGRDEVAISHSHSRHTVTVTSAVYFQTCSTRIRQARSLQVSLRLLNIESRVEDDVTSFALLQPRNIHIGTHDKPQRVEPFCCIVFPYSRVGGLLPLPAMIITPGLVTSSTVRKSVAGPGGYTRPLGGIVNVSDFLSRESCASRKTRRALEWNACEEKPRSMRETET